MDTLWYPAKTAPYATMEIGPRGQHAVSCELSPLTYPCTHTHTHHRSSLWLSWKQVEMLAALQWRCVTLPDGAIRRCAHWTSEMVFTNQFLTIQKSLQESRKSNDPLQLWWSFVDTLASVSRPSPSGSEVLCVPWESGPAQTSSYYRLSVIPNQLGRSQSSDLWYLWHQPFSVKSEDQRLELTVAAQTPTTISGSPASRFPLCWNVVKNTLKLHLCTTPLPRLHHVHWAAATGLAWLNVCMYMTKWLACVYSVMMPIWTHFLVAFSFRKQVRYWTWRNHRGHNRLKNFTDTFIARQISSFIWKHNACGVYKYLVLCVSLCTWDILVFVFCYVFLRLPYFSDQWLDLIQGLVELLELPQVGKTCGC